MIDKGLIITIVIQARMSSSRLEGKVMLPILDQPLLYRMIERVKQIKHSVNIVVATTTEKKDYKIVQLCHDKNITFYRGDLNNLLDRHYQVGLTTGADIVIKIPSDCPLIDPEIIDKVIDFLKGINYCWTIIHQLIVRNGHDFLILNCRNVFQNFICFHQLYCVSIQFFIAVAGHINNQLRIH